MVYLSKRAFFFFFTKHFQSYFLNYFSLTATAWVITPPKRLLDECAVEAGMNVGNVNKDEASKLHYNELICPVLACPLVAVIDSQDL